MAQFNTKKIRAENPLNDVAARSGLKLTRDGKEWKACCPFHSEKTASFTIFVGRDKHQRFFCHGCGETGDVIDFVQDRYGVDFSGACEILGGKRDAPLPRIPSLETGEVVEDNDPYAGYVVKRPPADAPPIKAADATPPLLNPKRQNPDGTPKLVVYKPKLVHAYRDRNGELLAYVLRIDIAADKKITPCIVWMENEATGFAGWSHGKLPEPRPPYGLPDLYARPDYQILIVEGEKCRDRARSLLADKLTPIAWQGGGKAIEKTNWKHLRGRRIVIWPDNDPEGENTALGYYDRQGDWKRGLVEIALENGAEAIKVITRPGASKPKGWDIADAHDDDKWDAGAILNFARANSVIWDELRVDARKETLRAELPDSTEPQIPDDVEEQAPKIEAKPTQQAKPKPEKISPQEFQRPQQGNVISLHGAPIPVVEVADNWRANLLFNEEGKLKPRTNQNFKWMLRGHEDVRGVFAWNEMARDIFVVKRPPWSRKTGDWQQRKITDDDVINSVGFLECLHLSPKAGEALSAIALVSKDYAYHPVRHYLENLTWDGCPRIQGGLWEGAEIKPFTVEYFGAPNGTGGNIYAVFFMRWMVSAVARIFRPGCKADCMIVMEGKQGIKKSSFVQTLATIDGVSYFTDSVHDIENKDTALTLQGIWLAEIPELDAFRRKEADAIKAWLSRNQDRFRPPYAKMVQDFPRQSVIAGTMNPSGHGYLRDPTGARRFWPIPIMKNIEREEIIKYRDQIWAEAVHLYRRKIQWWLNDSEVLDAIAITDERYEEDPWQYYIDEIISGSSVVSVKDILKHLDIPKSQQNGLTVKRVAEYLRRKGFTRQKIRIDLHAGPKNVWVRPGSAHVKPGAVDDEIDA